MITFTGDRVKIFLFYSSSAVLTLDWLLDWFEEDMSYLRRVEIRCRKEIVCEERKDIASFEFEGKIDLWRSGRENREAIINLYLKLQPRMISLPPSRMQEPGIYGFC